VRVAVLPMPLVAVVAAVSVGAQVASGFGRLPAWWQLIGLGLAMVFAFLSAWWALVAGHQQSEVFKKNVVGSFHNPLRSYSADASVN
jgi:hypothetical protein